jgi:hypothetical protein
MTIYEEIIKLCITEIENADTDKELPHIDFIERVMGEFAAYYLIKLHGHTISRVPANMGAEDIYEFMTMSNLTEE